MSTGTNDFDKLKRMLALKGREQPPRQFFNKFSDTVLHNLDAPERPETQSWLERLGVHFDVSPAVVGTVAICICTLLAGGIAVAMRRPPPLPAPPPDPGVVAGLGQAPVASPTAGEPSQAGEQTAPLRRSTDPIMTPEQSPIQGLNSQIPKVQPTQGAGGN
jgi:hypothetical protein